ncbi:MAG: hypothetical protein ACFFB3_00535 [Candidatus Hodarchaeota archaeon]
MSLHKLIDQDELFKELNSRYQPRLNRIEKWTPGFSLNLVKEIPNIPLEYSPSSEGLVAIKLAPFVTSCIVFAKEAITSFVLLWRNRQFLTFIFPARLLFEIWASTYYAKKILSEMKETGNVKNALEESDRLVLGTLSEVIAPWGEKPLEIASIRTDRKISTLKEIYPKADVSWGFLSESVHLSFIQLIYWFSINFNTNPIFKQHIHELMDQTLELIEQSLEGIAKATGESLELALPYIRIDSKGLRVGEVTKFYRLPGVVEIKLSGTIKVGDTLCFKRGTNLFFQTIESIEMNNRRVKAANLGEIIGIKISKRIKPKTEVFLIDD